MVLPLQKKNAKIHWLPCATTLSYHPSLKHTGAAHTPNTQTYTPKAASTTPAHPPILQGAQNNAECSHQKEGGEWVQGAQGAHGVLAGLRLSEPLTAGP